ncbi:AAA family ATPase [Streptococcus pseudoporcinus]|uniref:Zeta toxin domain protein n=1 Tax=Streptococcus pseudoporcinus LQ 940-04 TaxID=875093 RepID=G5KA88_9STRE|nr:AAA family ATPase [Streptococcus pseudoporcinus]EFR43556.1 hypothetical protein HMPREF9320_1317 [Streptococcus pseudoporcinus SPIN 20026]EHI64920.1 zeta toxin domain protein [Streptococcus pseudoporcinus LQ 940-04]VEF93612.1 putative kinase [Streptococcus pseudoporcinus]
MPNLIIIRGNAASGKSSLARALQQQLGENTLRLSQDDLRRGMLLAHDSFDTPTISLLKTLLHYGFNNCDYIILEGILKADWYQPIWHYITENPQIKTFAYYYDLTFEETVKRHSQRAKSKDFGKASLKKWWNDKDYIKTIPEQLFNAELSIEQALSHILKEIEESQDASS